jgi:putative phosphonate transport system ATP-binding protein
LSAGPGGAAGREYASMTHQELPLLSAREICHFYGKRPGCVGVCFDLFPGEVMAVVGESGSGKSTLLSVLSTQLAPTSGRVLYRMRSNDFRNVFDLNEAELRLLMRTDWGFIYQDPAMGLRMSVSAGANIGERLMAIGERHYGRLRANALRWLERVDIAADRLDDEPTSYSGGMRQRLQFARNLVSHPRLVFMDEPTGGLDVSVQARLLDLLRGLVSDLGLSVVIVTHDLAVARILSHRIMVMRHGRVIEEGLTDQVLDDPAQPYTQLLVSSVLQV